MEIMNNQTRILFVRGFPAECTEEQLKSHFDKAGTIITVTILRRPNGNSRRVAFIEFIDNESAVNALKLNETRIGNSIIECNLRMTREELKIQKDIAKRLHCRMDGTKVNIPKKKVSSSDSSESSDDDDKKNKKHKHRHHHHHHHRHHKPHRHHHHHHHHHHHRRHHSESSSSPSSSYYSSTESSE